MRKIIFVFTCIVGFAFNCSAVDSSLFYTLVKEPTSKNYPIKRHHSKLGFSCAICHGDFKGSDKKLVSKVPTSKCMKCHTDYKNLANRTAHLGYDDNIHSSPHYPDMDCNLCHHSHKKSQNYCIMCHSQNSMKNIMVP